MLGVLHMALLNELLGGIGCVTGSIGECSRVFFSKHHEGP